MPDDLSDSSEEPDRLKREMESLRAGLLISMEAEKRRLAASVERYGEGGCER